MIENILDFQAQLIGALDAGDADAILSVSAALANALEKLRADDGTVAPQSLELGLKQAEAARIRVKYLTAWNRQKIDRLGELRGQSTGNIYAKPHVSA